MNTLLQTERFTAPKPMTAIATLDTAMQACGRCSGSGKFIGRTGKVLGECFTCNGSGKVKSPAARAAQRAVVDEARAVVVNDDLLRATFDKLLASGLKRVKLRMSGFAVKPAPAHGKNAGALYVTEGETYLGKVAGGKFIRMDCCTQETAEKVAALMSDPLAAIKECGVITGACSICGLTLTDPESIIRGVGPICAERLGI